MNLFSPQDSEETTPNEASHDLHAPSFAVCLRLGDARRLRGCPGDCGGEYRVLALDVPLQQVEHGRDIDGLLLRQEGTIWGRRCIGICKSIAVRIMPVCSPLGQQ